MWTAKLFIVPLLSLRSWDLDSHTINSKVSSAAHVNTRVRKLFDITVNIPNPVNVNKGVQFHQFMDLPLIPEIRVTSTMIAANASETNEKEKDHDTLSAMRAGETGNNSSGCQLTRVMLAGIWIFAISANIQARNAPDIASSQSCRNPGRSTRMPSMIKAAKSRMIIGRSESMGDLGCRRIRL